MVCFLGFRKKDKIDVILQSDAYSYLPMEAKEYIKSNYEETGNVALTEKNKKEGMPYLNPLYIDYLTLSDEEKNNLEIIPSATVVDYIATQDYENSSFPSSYDLRNVNGKNYVTPVRNQYGSNICWAFASAGAIESHLLKTADQTYTSNAQLISERQLDYATSNNGMLDINKYQHFLYRPVGQGSTFESASTALASGVSIYDYNDFKHDLSMNRMYSYEVLNFNKSLYELNETVNIPINSLRKSTGNLTSNQIAKYDAYINDVKSQLMAYGALYVEVPFGGTCAYQDPNIDNMILDNYNCDYGGGHALQIIGWDDNFEYSYCNDKNKHTTDLTNCNNIVNGQGVWILKNSYGEEDNPHPYLTYDSLNSQIYAIKKLAPHSEKDWDNNYIQGGESQTMTNKTYSMHDLLWNGDEELKHIKFMTNSVNMNYTITIEDKYQHSKVITASAGLPGWVTVDVSDNVLINDETTINITTSDGMFIDKVIILTSNNNHNPIVSLDNYQNGHFANATQIFSSETRSIDSGETINYRLLTLNHDDVSQYITVSANIVADNVVNPRINLENVPNGSYIIEAIYNNEVVGSADIVVSNVSLYGQGTEDNPYLIFNESDLNQMRYDLEAFYKLQDDITLTNEWVPIGTEEMPFKGGLDGDGHSINNLTINSDNNTPVGFFGYVYVRFTYSYDDQNHAQKTSVEKTYFKNIRFVNANVSNYGDAGVLAGVIEYNVNRPQKYPDHYNSSYPQLYIDSIHFIGGSVTSINGRAGVLTSEIINLAKANIRPYLYVNNSYSSVSLTGKTALGYIAFVNDAYLSGSGIVLRIQITNFQNTGIINLDNDEKWYTDPAYSPVVGRLYGNCDLKLENYLINSIVKYDYYGSWDYRYAIGSVSDKSDYKPINLSHGAYIYRFDHSYTTTLASVKADTVFNGWPNYTDYWKQETIDGIKRIPVLKDIDYSYTSMDDININLYDNVSLLDYITGQNDYLYINKSILNNDGVVEIYSTDNGDVYTDYKIKALKSGTATIHVENYYDGFEKDININVSAPKVNNPTITYYYNNLSGSQNYSSESYTQNVNKLTSFSLRPVEFERPGYSFVGWNTMPNGQGTTYTDQQLIANGIDENLELYAQWQIILYTLRYDANGGTGTMNDSNFYLSNNSSKKISNNLFVKDGYNFAGWNTAPDGSGTHYDNNGAIPATVFYALLDPTLVLYAEWEVAFDYIINNLNVDETKAIIYKLPIGMTPNDFTPNITINYGYGTRVDTKNVNNQEVLYTGGKFTVTKGLADYKAYSLSVLGDVNGDGKIGIIDYIRIMKHIMGDLVLENEYSLAADMNENSRIDIIDYIRIMKIIMEES
jgi:uncharacterized repeat protein (TIGR02543 family)